MVVAKKYLPWLLLIIAIFIILFYKNKYENAQTVSSGILSITKAQSDSIRYFTDKEGQQAAEIQATQITVTTLKQYLDTKTKEADDWKQKFLNAQIKSKNVTSGTTVVSVTGTQGKNAPITVTIHDTIIKKVKELKFDTVNKYFSISGIIDSNRVKFSNLNFRDTLNIIVGWKRKNILSEKQFMVIANNSNPMDRITGLSNISVIPDKNLFSKPSTDILIGGFAGVILTLILLK